MKRESRSSKELEEERGRVDDPPTVEVDLEPAIGADLPWGLKPKSEANRPSKSFISAGISEGKIGKRKQKFSDLRDRKEIKRSEFGFDIDKVQACGE